MKKTTVKPSFYVVIGHDTETAEGYADIEYSLKDCMRTHPAIIIPVHYSNGKNKRYTGTVLPLQTLK